MQEQKLWKEHSNMETRDNHKSETFPFPPKN